MELLGRCGYGAGFGYVDLMIELRMRMFMNWVLYFAMMFRLNFRRGSAEANTRSAHFPEDNPDLSDVLLGWVYQDTIQPLTLKGGGPHGYLTSWNILDIYILAENFCSPELQDQVMDFSTAVNGKIDVARS